MPAKKKTVAHPKKKMPVIHEEEKPEGHPQGETPKQDRPVMQVVQVPETETPVPEVSESKPAETPAPVAAPEATLPVETPTATPAPVEAPTEKGAPATEPMATTPAVSAPASSIPATTPSPSETFLEGLPPVKSSKKGLIIVLIILLLILVGGVGAYIYWSSGMKLPTSISSLLPLSKSSQVKLLPHAKVTPTPTPAPVNKSAFMIKVLNGSGIAGAAGKLQTTLIAEGYSVSSTGNADNSDYTETQILVTASVSKEFIAALRADLSKAYTVSATVGTLPSSSATDVDVIIGSKIAQ
jgi:hypothetical protein